MDEKFDSTFLKTRSQVIRTKEKTFLTQRNKPDFIEKYPSGRYRHMKHRKSWCKDCFLKHMCITLETTLCDFSVPTQHTKIRMYEQSWCKPFLAPLIVNIRNKINQSSWDAIHISRCIYSALWQQLTNPFVISLCCHVLYWSFLCSL